MTWAIKNSKTGKWLYGTKYGHGQNTQNTSHNRIQTWETKELAEIEYRHRKCGKAYKVVPVEIVEVTE